MVTASGPQNQVQSICPLCSVGSTPLEETEFSVNRTFKNFSVEFRDVNVHYADCTLICFIDNIMLLIIFA